MACQIVWLSVVIVHLSFVLIAQGNPVIPGNVEINQVLQQLEDKRKNVSTCDFCQMGFEILDAMLRRGVGEDLIAEIAVKVCIKLELENVNEIVCKGAINEFKDEVIYTAINSALDAPTACGILRICPKVVKPKTWTVPIPDGKPPVVPVQMPPTNAKTYKVLHISDTHWDSLYQEGSEAFCGEPLCCRDFMENPHVAAWKWGTYADCDIPDVTVAAIYDDALKHDIDYIIWTGDLPAHNVWNQSRAEQRMALSRMVELLSSKFPNTRVFPTVGNHESAPVNSFPPDYVEGKYRLNWLYDDMAANWSRWVNDTESQKTIKHMGSYETEIDSQLHLISINTNYGNDQNFWLYINDTDPQGMLAWLTERLLQAELNNIKVHLIAHIQPSSTLDSFRHNLEKILYRFESTVVAQFYGHTHSDEFEVYYEDGDSTKRPIGVALMPGSMTTYSYKNPQYRIYTIDGDRPNSTYAVLDFVNYYMDLKGSDDAKKPLFYEEYKAKETYRLPSLGPESWSDLIVRMARNATLFDLYHRFEQGSAPRESCDDGCRLGNLCGMRSDTTDNKNKCRDLQDIISPTPSTISTSATRTAASVASTSPATHATGPATTTGAASFHGGLTIATLCLSSLLLHC